MQNPSLRPSTSAASSQEVNADFIVQVYDRYRYHVNNGIDPITALNRVFKQIRDQNYANDYRRPKPGDVTDPRISNTAHDILWTVMIDNANEDKEQFEEKKKIEEEQRRRAEAGEVEDAPFFRQQIDFLSQARRLFRDRFIFGLSPMQAAESVIEEIRYGFDFLYGKILK